MKLRKLERNDAPYMLEWMHDEGVTSYLQTDFASKSLQDVEGFIEKSHNDEHNMHLAIASSDDEYMGTVSLKNINRENAEFAIAVRKEAMGKGYAQYGMKEILKKANNELKLEYVYWCVDPDNIRAIRFYEKNNYHQVSSEDITIMEGYSTEQIKKYCWFKYMN